MLPQNHPILQLIHNTVRILCYDSIGGKSSGTGYLYSIKTGDSSFAICLITNKHVIKGAIRGSINLTLKNPDGTAKTGHHELIEFDNLQRKCIHHPNPNIDLVAISIGPVINEAEKSNKRYHFCSINSSMIASPEMLSNLSPMEDIIMIGYPNGIWDEKHNLPIIRKGITATHADVKLNGKPEFLIDAACFPGSSGSPVFLANIGNYLDENLELTSGVRIALLGTLYAGPQHSTTGEVVVVDVPTDTKVIARGLIPNNLGYVIQASQLLELEKAIVSWVNSWNELDIRYQ